MNGSRKNALEVRSGNWGNEHIKKSRDEKNIPVMMGQNVQFGRDHGNMESIM